MKVKDLIKELADFDPDSEIILQKDGEGNGFSPLAGADGNSIYVPETTWCGAVYSTNRSAEDNGFEEDEWLKIKKKNKKCVVLWPTN